MSSLVNNVKDTIIQSLSNTKVIMILVVTSLFIALAFWVYNTYIVPKLQPDFADNKEFISKDSEDDPINTAQIYMFYTDWCPHCKKAMKETGEDASWKPIRSKYNNKTINGVKVTFNEINGEKEETALNNFEKKHDIVIGGYPSIYLVKGNSIIEFEADINRDNLSKFLNTAL